jgi:hypothetical protein
MTRKCAKQRAKVGSFDFDACSEQLAHVIVGAAGLEWPLTKTIVALSLVNKEFASAAMQFLSTSIRRLQTIYDELRAAQDSLDDFRLSLNQAPAQASADRPRARAQH